ncbi:BON domain-containing protein [Actinoplanes sp. GCM10030250]|uniref:BON domain-containing protein n=1 Tax=Actinoplanes sp. GCM10030250 TaxID=3273376 RepID=UPI00360AAA6F
MPFDDGSPFRSDPDVLLTYQVIARIVGSPGLRGERITVRVQNRVVILLGTVRSAAARLEAASRARATPGIEDVCDRLAGPAAPELFDEMVAGLEHPAVVEPAWTYGHTLVMVGTTLTLAAMIWLMTIA